MAVKIEKTPAETFCPQNFPERYHMCGGSYYFTDNKNNKILLPNCGEWIYRPIWVTMRPCRDIVYGKAIICSTCKAVKKIIREYDGFSVEEQSAIEKLVKLNRIFQIFEDEIISEKLNKEYWPKDDENLSEYKKRVYKMWREREYV